MSPQEYILNYRMNQASILLKNTSLPVSEIADKVGYDDALNFSKAFKKIYGINPTNFRSTTDSLITSDEDTQNEF
jgi:AraC family transcriptional regulator of arabinose operon